MNIIEARNIRCSYTGDRTALQVNQLDIPAGQLTFILGVSGVGKSTILETLGLMSNTLFTHSDSEFTFHHEGQVIDMAGLWKSKEKVRSAFREQHLSFIFQSTNLMNNMSVLENAKVTQLIQGVPDLKAEQIAKQFLHRIELVERNPETGEMMESETLEMWNKPPQAISGGQRQRLAFARAVATNASLLFADEPTGNLDAWNAKNLVDVLTSELKIKGQTAVIVTHDIPLALAHAHQIVCIRKTLAKDKEGKVYTHGVVDVDFTFAKNGESWTQNLGGFQNQLTTAELHSFLIQAMEADTRSNSKSTS